MRVSGSSPGDRVRSERPEVPDAEQVGRYAHVRHVVLPVADFVFYRADGTSVRASTANSVVQMLSEKGGSSDVLKLVNAYELSLYGIPNMRSTNGYEQRRQAALLSGGNRFRAAAAASAVALTQTKLAPGDSSDGAVFFPTGGKPLGPGPAGVAASSDGDAGEALHEDK